jgi:hypothetical protein
VLAGPLPGNSWPIAPFSFPAAGLGVTAAAAWSEVARRFRVQNVPKANQK